jgi:hypothetical protein
MKTRRKPATRPALRAVRTVSETDEVRIIEGLGIPFGGPFAGRDSYGTFASPRTDFFWDLFPDVVPLTVRAGDVDEVIGEARFIRPVTYNHGFDSDIGLSRIGGWSPVRTDPDGVWVQAQIDKRAKWYARIAPLLDKNALGFSSGSAEHAVRFDERTGEWLEWPVYELALTPTEANPLAAIAARAAAAGTRLGGQRILAVRTGDLGGRGVSRETSAPNALRYSSAAWDASAAAWTLSSLIDLLGEEGDETEQATHLRNAIAELQAFIELELAEVGTPEDAAESAADSTFVEESITVTAWASGVREGRRNSTSDTDLLTVAHDNLASVLDLSCAPSDDSSDDATARSADAQPVLRIVGAVRSDADAQRELAAMAEKAGRDAAARLTGKPG